MNEIRTIIIVTKFSIRRVLLLRKVFIITKKIKRINKKYILYKRKTEEKRRKRFWKSLSFFSFLINKSARINYYTHMF